MGTTVDKLQKLMQTKDDIKTAINDPELGDRFADYPTAITDGKAYIAQKITEKGVAASRNDTFQQLGDKVGEIQNGSTIKTCNVTVTVSAWLPFSVTLIYPFYNDETILIKEYVPRRNDNFTFSVLQGSYIFANSIEAYESGDITGSIEKISSITGPGDYAYAYKVNGDGTISW